MVSMAREQNYPGGLCIFLGQEELTKLGITDIKALPVGMTFPMDIMVRVTGISDREGYDGPGSRQQCLDLQITEIGLETEADEDKKPVADSVGGRLYGDDNG